MTLSTAPRINCDVIETRADRARSSSYFGRCDDAVDIIILTSITPQNAVTSATLARLCCASRSLSVR